MGDSTELRLKPAAIRTLDTELDAAAGPGHPASALKPGVQSPGGVAVAGVEGYLFIGDGANRWERQYLGELQVAEDWTSGWAAILARRQAESAARGVALWNLIVPEKQVVYPDKRWLGDLRPGDARPLRRLQAALPADARLIYPEAALRDARAAAPAYYRHNSHWTPSGCCAVARAVLDAFGVGVDLESLEFRLRRTRDPQDLTAHLFDPPPPEDMAWLEPAGDRHLDNQHLRKTGRHAGSIYGLRNPDAVDPRRLILFGDSYAHDAGLAAALSVVFAEVVSVWSKSVVWPLVEEHKADLVLWEGAERFLATLPMA